jgi:hypothetical protein
VAEEERGPKGEYAVLVIELLGEHSPEEVARYREQYRSLSTVRIQEVEEPTYDEDCDDVLVEQELPFWVAFTEGVQGLSTPLTATLDSDKGRNHVNNHTFRGQAVYTGHSDSGGRKRGITMSIPINELPQIQKDVLIILRRQTVSTERLIISLRAEAVECPDPLPVLEMLVALEFVSHEEGPDGKRWSLTDKGRVAAELLWFERKYEDASKLFGALGGG